MATVGARPTGGGLAGAVLAAPPAALARLAQLVWAHPAVLVVVTLAAVCLPAADGGGDGGARVSPADLCAVALVALVLARAVLGRPSPPLRTVVLAPMVAMVCAVVAATMTATDPGRSIVGALRFIELFVAIPLAVALTLRERVDVSMVLGAVIAVGIVEGVIGSYQALTGTGAGFGEDGVRAVGTFGAYNIMALPAVVTFALLAAVAVAVGGVGPVRRVGAWCALLLVVPLALSLSRGSWLAAAAATLVILAASGVKRMVLVCGVAGLVAFAGIGMTQPDLGVIGSRADTLLATGSAPDRSVRDRYDLWGTAVDMWQDRPVTGVGVKNFSLWRDTYAPLTLSSTSDVSDATAGFRRVELLSPHNTYLLVLSEQGILGIAAFLGFSVVVGAGATARLRGARAPGVDLVMGLFAVGYLVRYAVAGLWGDPGGASSVASGILLGVVLAFAAAPRLDR